MKFSTLGSVLGQVAICGQINHLGTVTSCPGQLSLAIPLLGKL